MPIYLTSSACGNWDLFNVTVWQLSCLKLNVTWVDFDWFVFIPRVCNNFSISLMVFCRLSEAVSVVVCDDRTSVSSVTVNTVVDLDVRSIGLHASLRHSQIYSMKFCMFILVFNNNKNTFPKGTILEWYNRDLANVSSVYTVSPYTEPCERLTYIQKSCRTVCILFEGT